MLWAITSYFNPAGYLSRLRNYRIFRANLTVPLVAVELSRTGEFQLRRDDAEIVVQIAGGDVLWQKERLLNVALASLPADCDQVAWIDCDVVFTNRDWPAQAAGALGESLVIHLFSERCNLAAEARLPPVPAPCEPMSESAVRKIVLGTAVPDDIRKSNAPVTRRSTAGLAWAARRELLDVHGLYDACILGSGDRAILCAALGRFDYGIDALNMRGCQSAHYLAWALPFHQAVGGKIGFIEGRICHLWHGDPANRKYSERHEGLAAFEFDPFTDLAKESSGCWRWNGTKTEMHEYVRGYFESRKEDG